MHEQVVVDEEERAAPEPGDLRHDVVHRPAPVLRVHRGDAAEAAPVGASPRGLDEVGGEIGPALQQAAVEVRVVREVGAVVAHVARLEPAVLEVVEERGPGVVGLADHDGVRVRGGFLVVRAQADVPSAEHNRDAARPERVREGIGAHRAHRADADGHQVRTPLEIDLAVVVVGEGDLPVRRGQGREVRDGERRHEALVDRELTGPRPDEQHAHGGTVPTERRGSSPLQVQEPCQAP